MIIKKKSTQASELKAPIAGSYSKEASPVKSLLQNNM